MGSDAGAAKLKVTFVTGNKKKLEEVTAILAAGDGTVPFVVDSEKMELPELQGEPLEIAAEKCRVAFASLRRPVMVEDTSLCFNALGCVTMRLPSGTTIPCGQRTQSVCVR